MVSTFLEREKRGMAVRFSEQESLIVDNATGLVWLKDALSAETGLSWPETFDFIDEMNRKKVADRSDWRLPNRRELYSLVDHSMREPALSKDHPFINVWAGKYWTSTTSARSKAYAWWVQLSGGRMFFGNKSDDCMVWPVCGTSETLHATGQTACYNVAGEEVQCDGLKQDGAIQAGLPWPEPRFIPQDDGILDAMTGLIWTESADLAEGMTDWRSAQDIITGMADQTGMAWRMPTIMELESLTDCDHADPALPQGHPFTDVNEAYWSATTSGYDADWAFCLYFHKGAVGVGYKSNLDFHVWAVREE
ncbi:conserved protein of unknown function [Pseudodesulfovibrio profundus]|uniref:Lcl C-terminal domain-containing protein n=2 Tax=Pseudodesulfovibrio profundus TaxID=57320 RepID=A0A2C8FE24_9BACT|nr:conserved protein of unknown function [Pseudodesulfovibrio profundus]